MSMFTVQTSDRIYFIPDGFSKGDEEVSFKFRYLTEKVFKKGKELKGLGYTKYGCFWGTILCILGYAFKCRNEAGESLYINKNSFCKGIIRQLAASKQPSDVQEDVIENCFYDWEVQNVNQIRTIFNRVWNAHKQNDPKNTLVGFSHLLIEMVKILEIDELEATVFKLPNNEIRVIE